MSETVAIVLPLPVAIALVFVLLILLALSAVALSLREPDSTHFPPGDNFASEDTPASRHARGEG